MTQPLALVAYENLLPGSQLTNRLRDLGYRVQALTELASLISVAEQEKPMLVLLDLDSQATDTCALLAQLRANPGTAHLPVLAFTNKRDPKFQTAAHEAGATLVAGAEGVIAQLEQLLEQALQME